MWRGSTHADMAAQVGNPEELARLGARDMEV